MRFAKASVTLLLFVLLLCSATLSPAAVPPDRSISGRLLYERGEYSCERCVVTLLMAGVRPVAVSYADLSGRFSFRNVPKGQYTIHIEIEGFDEVNQAVDTSDGIGYDTNVTVMLIRKPVVVVPRGDNVVDVSQLSERFPKKALDSFRKGLDSRKKGNNDQSIKYLEDAVRLAPEFYDAHNELGIAYKHARRVEDAEREFLRAHELNQSNADPLVNLTSLYIDENKPDRAVTTAEEAVKANSRSAPAFFNLGMALYKMAKLDRAEAALKKALELAPRMSTVRLMLANVYLKLRNRDKLMEQLDSYLAENPQGDQRQAVQEMRQQVLNASVERQP